MKKKVNRKANFYDIGGQFKWQKGAGFGTNMKNAWQADALNPLMSAVGGIGGLTIGGGLQSGVGNAMQGLSSIAGAIPGPWGAAAGAILSTTGGLVNKMFGSNINELAVKGFESANQQLANMLFGGSSTSDLLSLADFGLLGHINRSDIGSDGWFSNKAKNLANKLNAERELANLMAMSNYNTAVLNLDLLNDFLAMLNMAAFGGPINMKTDAPMSPFGNRFSSGGGIHIKKANRGKFTESANRAGMGVQEYARHILANKDDYSPTLIKRANFARNFGGNKKALGGPLFTNGADWSNGLITIDNGGTHEENPYDGVLMGVDEQGVPNLVEENEVVWNDYVFSDKLKPTEQMRKQHKLKGDSWADVVRNTLKESEERPNDPISKRSLDNTLLKYAMLQELQRQEKELKKNNQYKRGGKLGNILDGLGEWSNTLDLPSINGEDLLELFNKQQLKKLNKNKKSFPTWMRYSPAIGNVLAVVQNLLSKPDYSSRDIMFKEANNAGKYTPVVSEKTGTYMTYNPLDRNYLMNKSEAQNSAARRAILDSVGGNRAAAVSGLTANNYAALTALADAFIKMDEANLAKKDKTLAFNNQLDLVNASNALKASITNREQQARANAARADLMYKGLAMGDAIDAQRANALSTNLSGMFDNLGNIGRENFISNQVNSVDHHGYFQAPDGTVYYLGKPVSAKNGGYLTIKKRRRHG